MAVYLSPVGLAAAPVANQVTQLATFKEDLCQCVCSTSTNQPNATVTYETDTPILRGTTVFVPVIATVSILLPDNCGCNNRPPHVITERWFVAFEGQTALPTAVTFTPGGVVQNLIKVVCGKSNWYAINQTITVTITPPAAAA